MSKRKEFEEWFASNSDNSSTYMEKLAARSAWQASTKQSEVRIKELEHLRLTLSNRIKELEQELEDRESDLRFEYNSRANAEKQALRYDFVRNLIPAQFAEIYAINIKTGVHFDTLIDQEILETS